MNELFGKLVTYGKDLSPEVAKSVSISTNVGDALSSEWLAKTITRKIVKTNPELLFIMQNAEKAEKGAKYFKWDETVEMPAPGSSYGATGVNTERTGAVRERREVPMKIVRRAGAVSGYDTATSEGHINTPEQEYNDQLEVLGQDLVLNCLLGNVGGDQYRWDGLDSLITTNRISEGSAGKEVKDFTAMTSAIALSNDQGGTQHDRIFVMSSQLWAQYNNLITTVRENKTPILPSGTIGIEQAFAFDAYWKFVSFMGIPVIQSSWTRPREQMKPTVTAAKVATGGTLTDGTYYIKVAPITKYGEQIASDEVSVTLDAGTAVQSIKITLSESHKTLNSAGRSVENTYYYRIYMSTTSQEEKLVKIVTGMVYDANGNTIGRDNGIAGKDFYIYDLVDTDSVNTAMANDEPYLAASFDALGHPIKPPESLILWDLNKEQGLGTFGYTNLETDAMEGLVTSEWFAPQDDVQEFMIKVYGVLAGRFQASSVFIRGLKEA